MNADEIMALYRECLRVNSSQDSIGKDFDRVDAALRAAIERVIAERAGAFETWKKFHQATLAAFIKNEHQPMKERAERAERERDEALARIEALEREGENYDCNVAILTKQRDEAQALLREALDESQSYGGDNPLSKELLARIDALLKEKK